MLMPNKANNYIDFIETENRKKRAYKALHDSLLSAEAGKWDTVINLGLAYPENQDRIIDRCYESMPERIRYILPLKWYMKNGKASESVYKAVSLAGKYKPFLWIGKGSVNHEILTVFCCIKAGDKETAKDCLTWALDFGTAYLESQKINGKIFEACIKKEDILAYDEKSAFPVIQYRGVYAVHQVFPKIPLSCQ